MPHTTQPSPSLQAPQGLCSTWTQLAETRCCQHIWIEDLAMAFNTCCSRIRLCVATNCACNVPRQHTNPCSRQGSESATLLGVRCHHCVLPSLPCSLVYEAHCSSSLSSWHQRQSTNTMPVVMTGGALLESVLQVQAITLYCHQHSPEPNLRWNCMRMPSKCRQPHNTQAQQ